MCEACSSQPWKTCLGTVSHADDVTGFVPLVDHEHGAQPLRSCSCSYAKAGQHGKLCKEIAEVAVASTLSNQVAYQEQKQILTAYVSEPWRTPFHVAEDRCTFNDVQAPSLLLPELSP